MFSFGKMLKTIIRISKCIFYGYFCKIEYRKGLKTRKFAQDIFALKKHKN